MAATRRMRVVVDLVMDDAKLPTEHQQQVIANNVHNYIHLGLGIQDILEEGDVKVTAASPNYTVHVHDGTGYGCQSCAAIAQDGLA